MLQILSLQKLPVAIGGATCAQIYVGTKSYYTEKFGMKRESEAPRTLDVCIERFIVEITILEACVSICNVDIVSPRSRINALRSHLRVTCTMSRSLSRSHQICQMNQAEEIPSTFHRCIDGGADTGLFNMAHCHVESVTERHADIHMVRSKGHRSNVPIGTVLITVQPPLEEKPVIVLVFHEQLIGQEGDDIDVISCNQVRSYGHSVDDRATALLLEVYNASHYVNLEVLDIGIVVPFCLGSVQSTCVSSLVS